SRAPRPGRGPSLARAAAPSATRWYSPSKPAVDAQHRPCDASGLVGAEKAYCSGDVLRIAEPAERRVLQHQRAHLLRNLVCEPARDVPRSDDIRTHATASELARKRLRETDDPGLRRRVVRLAGVAVQPDDAGNVDDRA